MSEQQKRLDLVTIGRVSVDLYGDQIGGRLEDMGSFSKYVGGCPANIAIGCARLGLKSALLSRVGDDHMGRFITEQLTREGVAVEGVRTDPGRLTALVILGIRDRETFPLIFYRENCADMALGPGDVVEDFIRSARAVLVTGTHLSRPVPRAATEKAIAIAKQSGGRVIFDIDYRPVLWGLTQKAMGEQRFVMSPDVTQTLQRIVGACDVIVGTEEEFHILGGNTDTLAALRAVREVTAATLVCKLGAQGCVMFDGVIGAKIEDGILVPGFPVEVLNVLGAGDAFMSGFLSGWLKGMPLAECGRRGNAAGALVVSRHGCAPAMPTEVELEEFMVHGPGARVEHLHWATTRTGNYDNLKVFAIDHRLQLEELATEIGADPARIPVFKMLAYRALDKVAGGDPSYGILLDGRLGGAALAAVADRPYWIGRPIELSGSCPLKFECLTEAGVEINRWPLSHVVKCLVFYHPDDDPALKAVQIERLLALAVSCRAVRHELLIEVIASKNGSVDVGTQAEAVRQLYQAGLYPDWWKLEPADDPAIWSNVAEVIAAHDPQCRGILLLGLSRPLDELQRMLEAGATAPMVKGFAVGRTIFADPARDWLKNTISDDEAIERMAATFALLVGVWNKARGAAR